ncbi:MAG: hypothetical protein ACRDVP_09275, partial [Acidimicrobiales bacterium]
SQDPSVTSALARYRAAFELIDGEPLAGVLSGYGWWSSEGHQARVNSMIVDGACNAVNGAIREGMVDLAWWILDKARLVEHYSELLSRAAMVTAAAAGDRMRLQREWDECRRRVIELDPNGTPSPATQRLFDYLGRRSADPESLGAMPAWPPPEKRSAGPTHRPQGRGASASDGAPPRPEDL